MQRIFKRLNPLVAAAVFAAFLAPSAVSAQGEGWVRGYFDFFDNLCYPCTGQLEQNPYCTCMIRQADAFQASSTNP
jgi:hypothetical protein